MKNKWWTCFKCESAIWPVGKPGSREAIRNHVRTCFSPSIGMHRKYPAKLPKGPVTKPRRDRR